MIKRTHRIVKDNRTMYETTCTINGNEITGSVNPFPYMKRFMKKHNLTVMSMSEENNVCTLYVKGA